MLCGCVGVSWPRGVGWALHAVAAALAEAEADVEAEADPMAGMQV